MHEVSAVNNIRVKSCNLTGGDVRNVVEGVGNFIVHMKYYPDAVM